MQTRDTLELGDTVSICFSGIGRHEGIVTGYDRITARSYKYSCVSGVSISDFSGGKPEQIINYGHIGKYSKRETAQRAVNREGELGYSLIDKHCINFTNEVNGLPKYCRMGGISLTILTVGVCAYVGYKHKMKIA